MSGLSGKVRKLGNIMIYSRSEGISEIYTEAIIILYLLEINIDLNYNNIN
jgi:hypothetical protein